MAMIIFFLSLLQLTPARAQPRADGISTAYSAQPSTTYNRDDPNNCGFGPINSGTWQSNNIDSWFSQKAGNSALAGNLSSALRQEYALNVAQSIFNCDVDNICTPVSCTLIDLKQNDAKQAFFVLEAIANFNNFLKHFVDGIVAAQTMANSFTDQWVKQFSTVNDLERALKQRRSLLGILQAVFSFIVSFTGIYGAVAGAASAVIFSSVTSSLGDPPDKYDVAADLGVYIGKISNASTNAIRNLGQGLLSGKPDSKGNHLWQYLANGSFADTDKLRAADIEEFLKKQYVAAGINAVWGSQRTYIAAAPTKNGIACENDNRGPAESRLCLDQHRDRVFYAYMIPRTASSNTVYPQTFVPHGYTNLSTYAPLDMKSIMTSSVLAYDVAKFDYDSVRQERWIGALRNSSLSNSLSSSSSSLGLGYAFEGMFTLPVCFNPWGDGISKVKTDKNRHYPCQCFDPALTNITKPTKTGTDPLSSLSSPNANVTAILEDAIHPTTAPSSNNENSSSSSMKQETTAFLYAAGMNHDKVWFGFCNSKNGGDACGDIQGTVDGKLDVSKQNNTFGYCKLTSAASQIALGMEWQWWLPLPWLMLMALITSVAFVT